MSRSISRLPWDAPAYLCPAGRRTADQLRRTCDRRLNRLVEAARENHPHYARALPPAGTRISADRMEALPLLSRAALRDLISGMKWTDTERARLAFRRTSGSGGIPLELPCAPAEMTMDALLWLAVYARLGLRPGHLQAKFTNNPPGPARGIQRAGFFRRAYFPSGGWPREKVEWLKTVRPHAVFGWASLLGEIVTELEARNEQLHIPLIFSTSDMLWDGLRRRIGERLGGRVFDVYGAEETGPIAWECPVGGGYHVNTDWVIVEILDDQRRPALRGSLVCTVLWRRTVPLIRYQIGDAGEWETEPCPCGSPLPRLRRLHGREQNLMRLPGGEWISAGTLESLLYDEKNIGQFQFVQESEQSLCLRIVALNPSQEMDQAAILRQFNERFGAGLRLRIERVDHISSAGRAKFTPFITLKNP